MRRQDLERLTREQLIAEAERLGVQRPRVLTQPELIDEIIQRTETSEGERKKARGWLGRARDLLARVVERGLHLPEAARMLRSTDERGWPAPPPPLPTVTLAEIYAAQGHIERALSVLDEVIDRDPSHREARALRARLTEQLLRARGAKRPEPKDTKPEDPPISAQTLSQEAPPTRPSAPDPIEAAPSPAPEIEKVENVAPEANEVRERAKVSEAPLMLDQPFVAKDPSTEVEEVPLAHAEEAPLAEEAALISKRPLVLEEPLATNEPSATKEPSAKADPTLPARYDVDEIVAIAVDPFTLYLYWEVRPLTFAKAQSQKPDGRLVVRVVSVTPSWDKPFVETADIPVDALYGDRFLRDVRPGSNLRISVGWLSDGELLPFAVGDEVSSPRAEPLALTVREAEERGEISAVGAKTVEARPGAAALHAPFLAAPFLVAIPDDASFAARVEAASHRRPAAVAAPIDTGVAHFERPLPDGAPTAEGASPQVAASNRAERVIQHLAQTRSARRVVLGGASELVIEELGGASDLIYEELGGASDLV